MKNTRGEDPISTPTDRITAESFSEWYREHQRTKALRNGWVEPTEDRVTEADVFNPHALGRCHRRAVYEYNDVPEETRPSYGVLATGTYFEEEIVLPYLTEKVAQSDEVVRNSIWVDYSVEAHGSALRYQGLTDPVLLDEDGYPVLLTEVKTKETVDQLESPNEHHLPQVHAYQRGLSEKYDIEPPDAVLVYGSRKTFQIRVFEVAFDEEHWEDVVEWSHEQEGYRTNKSLPDASPELDWECSVCEYRHRCGRADTSYEDIGVTGFLPRYSGYPKKEVEEYLRAHEEAKLTPTLAHQYPELADTYGVFDWECWHCSATYEFGTVGWDDNSEETPLCPACLSNEIPSPLSGPRPADQLPTKAEGTG